MHARTVAAFDFDGTLLRRDSMMPFLRSVAGTVELAKALVAVAGPAANALLVDRGDRSGGRGAAKEQLFRRLLAGRTHADLVRAGQRFAHDLVGGQQLRADVYERWQHHLSAGHELVIVSASLQLYVDPLARLLGGAAGLGTRLLVGPDGRISGALDGPNCRGAEKVRRLTSWLGDTVPNGADPTDVFLYAYGDSAGDDELLRHADVGTRIGRRRLDSDGRLAPGGYRGSA